MKKYLLVVLSIFFILISCNLPVENKITDNNNIDSFNKNTQTEIKRIGIVKKNVDGISLMEKSVNVWTSTTVDRKHLFKLSPGDEVIVYGFPDSNGYVNVAQKKDTTIVGYIMEGFLNIQ